MFIFLGHIYPISYLILLSKATNADHPSHKRAVIFTDFDTRTIGFIELHIHKLLKLRYFTLIIIIQLDLFIYSNKKQIQFH